MDALTTVGWTIPHVYTPNDPDADQELAKSGNAFEACAGGPGENAQALGYERRSIHFAKAKREFHAHSALGLVYFRRDDYENSAKELQQATSGDPVPDQTDPFVLGTDLQNLKRYGEAEAPFTAVASRRTPRGAMQA